jgi:HSP20 family protein
MLWTELNRFGRGFDPWLDLDWPSSPRGPFTTPSFQAVEFPPVNIWVNADEAILTTEIPGMDPSSVEISVAGKTVTLRGRRAPEKEKEENVYHRQERWQGQFSKTIELPFNLESDRVEATFGKGILKVTLPKASRDKPKTIKVKSE